MKESYIRGDDSFRFSFALKLCFEFESHLNTGQVGDWGGKQQLAGPECRREIWAGSIIPLRGVQV